MKKTPKQQAYWGFDTKNIDTRVRAQDDFYRYANGGWIAKTAIPADEARWGSFNTLRYDTENQLKKIVEDTKEPLVRNMYASAMDMPRRNKLGSKPLQGLRAKVQSIKTKEELLETLAYLHVLGVSGFWGTVVDQDSKDSTNYILHLWQGGLGMPERDYYLLDTPEQKRVRDAYKQHIKNMLKLTNHKSQTIQKTVDTIMRIETALARASMKKEDTRDADKTYHKKSVAQLQVLSPVVDWKKYFAQTGAEKARHIIVGQPEFFKAVSKLLEVSPLDELKTYLEWHLVNNCASLLSEEFIKESFHFYATVLSGVKVMKPLWRRALGATNGALGDIVGKLYVQKHFPAASKRAMDALVNDLFDAYAVRIKKLDWMSAATNLNDIVFPAAILQWPFFDARADAAVNYAGIGSVIGHEITHGFDDQGAKFDAKGNMKKWWTVVDEKKFTKKTKPFIAQANVEEAADGVYINGRLTLGENMADSGGLIIAYEAYQKHLKKTGRKNIGGLSPEERFFLGFAQMEREVARPETIKMRALTDPHAPAPWRIKGPLSNFEPFYQTFTLKKGDKLFRPPSSRAQIW